MLGTAPLEDDNQQLLQPSGRDSRNTPGACLAGHHQDSVWDGADAAFSQQHFYGSSHTDTRPAQNDNRTAMLCLCGAHALARWGWRTWEFAVALILIRLFPSSLLLVSVFGLMDNLVRLVAGSLVGRYIDRTARLRGAVVCYGVQNVCIATSAAAAAVLVLLDPQGTGQLRHTQPVLFYALASTTLIAGASSSIGSMGAAVSVEVQHTKVLCGQDSAALRQLNSGMRAIDLSSQMLGPVASGLLMSYSSLLTAIIVLAAYSVAAWGPEAWLLAAAHKHSPALRQPKPPASSSSSAQPLAGRHLSTIASGWVLYFQQPTMLPSLALALLYLTVLSLGFLMTSFLAWQGLSEATISLFRAAGALSGLAATVLFHPLQRCGVGLVGAGVCGISWQLLCLLCGVVPVVIARSGVHPGATQGLLNPLGGSGSSVVHGSGVPAAVSSRQDAGQLPVQLLYVLLSGLVLSRCGLWLFDLAVVQLQQERVDDTQLGAVCGVQGSLQSGFEILSFVAGVVISRPQDFHWLMAGSLAAVCTAAALFVVYACSNRVLLLHRQQVGPDELSLAEVHGHGGGRYSQVDAVHPDAAHLT